MNHSDSGDIKILIKFPGKSIFENFVYFFENAYHLCWWRLFAWVIFGQNARLCFKLHFQQAELVKPTGLFDFSSIDAISTPVK